LISKVQFPPIGSDATGFLSDEIAQLFQSRPFTDITFKIEVSVYLHYYPKVEMNPSSWQWRAHIPLPDAELEATSGSPEDYDDRNGYLPDFLGDSSDFLVQLPLLRDKSDLLQVE
jgi:hypothetical protein